jgi:hypothetical protein
MMLYIVDPKPVEEAEDAGLRHRRTTPTRDCLSAEQADTGTEEMSLQGGDFLCTTAIFNSIEGLASL